MKNQFKNIKRAIEYGHMVEVRDLKSKQYCVCSFIQDDGNIVIMSAWRSKKEEAYDLLGYSLLEKYEVDELDLEIKIIPHRYKELPVGSLVDIIDCKELREMAKNWGKSDKATGMIGKKGFPVNEYLNDEYGEGYIVNKEYFPAWAITPHIEEEKREILAISKAKVKGDTYTKKLYYKDEYEEAIKDLEEVKQ